jgi:hypothetical protein
MPRAFAWIPSATVSTSADLRQPGAASPSQVVAVQDRKPEPAHAVANPQEPLAPAPEKD